MTDRTTPESPSTLPPNFEELQNSWYKGVAKVFARVHKQDVADVPLDIWKRLIQTTYDGVDVRPLYTRADEHAEIPEPGQFPFLRGAKVTEDNTNGWGVRETFGRQYPGEDALDPKAVNETLLIALENGTTDIRLNFTGSLEAADIPALLNNVYVDLAPIAVNAGKKAPQVFDALLSYIEAEKPANPDNVALELSAAPLTSAFAGIEDVSLDEAVELAVKAAKQPGDIRALLVDGVVFSNLGANNIQEIGYSLAVGVAYLRALTEAGLSAEEALGQITFRFAATDDQFDTIAKFRAARVLWARVAEVIGAPEAGRAPMHAVTAPVMFSQRDPWVNMLRVTVASFAAGVGGASSVEVLPFDYAVVGGMPNVSKTFKARIARNTNLLLLEESHLGYVADPAGGSYFVENLTEELADKAWEIFTSTEAAGGFAAAEANVREALDATWEKRRADIAHRRTKVTAINEFPNLAEAPLAPEARPEGEKIRRWASDFEALRNRSDDFLAEKDHRPLIGLLPLGPLAKHNIRTGFTSNLLASGGIAVANPGQVVPGEQAFEEAAKASPIVVLCAADSEYEASGQDAVKAARAAGAKEVLVAGSEKSFSGAAEDARPDGYLNMKIDAVAELSRLLNELGA
ncbi:MAG: methylmalonyl-CoA mutase family protein [Corynebacterium sp.]|uniref:methylmalonyl-CoA mutase family protein n=1 Tax=Corynebacterium sp. TaxID=1720 RepID=UPI0026DD0870|nr:methylmalonyl-CoA mutase family protein [Corynebacterium sp.]MDO5029062.1 methylmalonyl-CoA mutase family protein [Corynebacterium sp.]